MFQAYWNLTGRPFDKSIKPEQLFMSRGIKELLSRLQYMKQHRGIMFISGQPGTGKTTALRAFVNELSELSFQSFYVPLATVNVLDFYRQLNPPMAERRILSLQSTIICFHPAKYQGHGEKQ